MTREITRGKLRSQTRQRELDMQQVTQSFDPKKIESSLLQVSDVSLQNDAIITLGQHLENPLAITLAWQVLESGSASEYVLDQLAMVLAKNPDPARFIDLFSHSEIGVRRAALWGCAVLQSENSVPYLTCDDIPPFKYRGDKMHWMIEQIALHLNDQEPRVVSRAAVALGRIADQLRFDPTFRNSMNTIVDSLAQQLSHPNLETREICIRTLSECEAGQATKKRHEVYHLEGREEFVEPLLEILRESAANPSLKSAAILLLGHTRTKSDDAAQELVKCFEANNGFLENVNFNIATDCAIALAEMGRSSALRELQLQRGIQGPVVLVEHSRKLQISVFKI